jgi:tetratricopeptide (TPR) repeat protein
MKQLPQIVSFAVAGLLCFASTAFAVQQETSSTAGTTMQTLGGQPALSGPDNLDFTAANQQVQDWKARWELARVLSYVQRYDESIAEYKKVLKKKPDLTQAKLEMAKVMAWAGYTDQAQTILESFALQDLDPETRIELADIYAAQKEYDQAISIYQEYLDDNPQNNRIRLKLAQTLSWASEYEKSLQHYKTLVAKHPKDIQLRRQYAQVLTWAEHYDQAISEYRKTLQD